jgi:hypothetical protein
VEPLLLLLLLLLLRPWQLQLAQGREPSSCPVAFLGDLT